MISFVLMKLVDGMIRTAAPSTVDVIKPFKLGGRGVCMSPLPEFSSIAANSPPMPWFGIDIGGSLVKVVYFEPTDDSKESQDHENLKTFVKGRSAYCNTGTRDVHLQMDNATVNKRRGSLHFIRFPTSQMKVFLRLVKNKQIASVSSTVCATGGGAFKFEEDFQKLRKGLPETENHGKGSMRQESLGTYGLEQWSANLLAKEPNMKITKIKKNSEPNLLV
ncbi:pantothenate kinase 1 [Trichonephila clavipes]|nr:pantothenate kinase 1 [Trichonephila clavipes]